MLGLVGIGVLSSTRLRKNRRLGYFAVAVVALALPGPDPLTTPYVLAALEKYDIPANIEYEYMGKDDPVTEVARCVKFCKEALA